MIKSCWAIALACCLSVVFTRLVAADQPYRPPAVPLVAHNPMFSIWSMADKLTDDTTRHWTKKSHSLTCLMRIDGKNVRVMGAQPADVEALPQQSVEVLLTRTIYNFEGSGIHLTLTFFDPDLPDDIDVLSRPLTYLVWDVKSTDGQPHDVSALFSASSALSIDHPSQQVTWEHAKVPGFNAVRVGSVAQAYCVRNGDDSRIDWGYAYIAAPTDQSTASVANADAVFSSFTSTGKLPPDDTNTGRAVSDGDPTLALAIDFGKVAAEPVERRAMIAYDDVFMINYFGKNRPGYWRRTPGMDGEKLIALADKQYPDLLVKCKKFDTDLIADITKVGGADYAYMCCLAYRQCIAGCGIAADTNNQPIMFTKENTSNGNMATVDVLFPMDPIWVFLSPTLAKATVAPVFMYGCSPMWKLPYAPHDLGEYPRAFSRSTDNGTHDPSEAMPVEESGNMIILADAIAHCDGNTKFVDPYWPAVTKWVDYLEKYGPDPEEQLCTDDFNGRLAHNSNLAVKAIVGLGAFADLCKMKGDMAGYNKYITLARNDAKHWMQAAGDGDHYRLAYDKAGTWSQVYNLVWDKILGLDVFPPEVAEKEIAHYKTVLKPYGLPLDSRKAVTKTDWTLWTASLASNQEDFKTLTNPLMHYLQETPDRVPFVDGYQTDKPRPGDLFHARPVIGGVFVYMLTDKPMWKKWSSMDHQNPSNWGALPLPPDVTDVVPTSRRGKGIAWKYTTDNPGADYFKTDFNDSGWKTGNAGFGHDSAVKPHTQWTTGDIWIRREFDMPDVAKADLQFDVYHDEDCEIYINGVLAGTAEGYNDGYQPLQMNDAGKAALKVGKNQIAVHCHQTVGGQYIDVGIAKVTERTN
jgi:hypothetical protein